jgi:3D (Asp-Asp-Asp) domain-containing protein
MKNFVRGAALLAMLTMFVVVIYAQGTGQDALIIANDSQFQIENTITDESLDLTSDIESETISDDLNKTLIKKTVMVSGRGGSKGSFSATAYCLNGKTAMGTGVRRGIIAADPRVLKLGSSVYLEAGAYSGMYKVTDTGGAIKGKKIDVWVPNCGEARRFGRRSIQVFAN